MDRKEINNIFNKFSGLCTLICLLLVRPSTGGVPICTADNMGDNPFCFPPDYNKDLIPPVEDSLQVHVETYIFEVSKIDDISLTITFELYMDLMWEESRIIINETSPSWGPAGTFMGSTNFVEQMWLPDIQIYKCKQFKKRQIVTDVAGLIIYKNRQVLYTVSTEVILACPMKFSAYPLDHQTCKFLVYLTTGLFVVVSWISFIVPPEVVPGRMALLVTLFLVLVNIFNSVTANAPKAEGLTAVEMWVVLCIIHVFAVLAEYAVILKLIQNVKRKESKERRREERYARAQMDQKDNIHLLNLHPDNQTNRSAPHTCAENRRNSHGEELAGNNGHARSENRFARHAACLVQGDGETSLVNNGNKDGNHRSTVMGRGVTDAATKVLRQLHKETKNERSKQVQEQIDRVALYLFPIIFLMFNLIYWPYYLFFIDFA